MLHGLSGHECDRFWAKGLSCPFRKKGKDDEERREDQTPDNRGIPDALALPGRKGEERNNRLNAQGTPEGNIVRLVQSEFDPEELQRAAIRTVGQPQKTGGMTSVPNIESLLRGRGVQGVMALLTALGVAEGFRRSVGKNFGGVSNRVRAVERQVSTQLRGLGQTSSSTGRGGRGGFSVNANEALNALVGIGPRRKLKRGVGEIGFGSVGPENI